MNSVNPPRQSRRDRAAATRERVIQAATEVFTEAGYAGTRMVDIADPRRRRGTDALLHVSHQGRAVAGVRRVRRTGVRGTASPAAAVLGRDDRCSVRARGARSLRARQCGDHELGPPSWTRCKRPPRTSRMRPRSSWRVKRYAATRRRRSSPCCRSFRPARGAGPGDGDRPVRPALRHGGLPDPPAVRLERGQVRRLAHGHPRQATARPTRIWLATGSGTEPTPARGGHMGSR